MGMYDEIQCKYPLPVEGANAHNFQTKDTPAQFLDHYEIREDGTLWHEVYDIEDHSDPKAEGIAAFMGCMTRVNNRWIQETDFTGEICFYDSCGADHTGWIEFSTYFVKGQLKQLEIITNRPPKEIKESADKDSSGV